MPSVSARAYKESLPKFNRINFWELATRLGTIASIFGFGVAIFYFQQRPSEMLLSIFLIGCTASMIGYVLFQEKRKLNRYSQATIFAHYINHITRDLLEKQKETRSAEFNIAAISSFLLNPISTCFSIITARNCRVCLKIINSEEGNPVVETLARDDVSRDIGRLRESRSIKHLLEKNTDFRNLWYWEKGCSRYFLCNNLQNLFRDNLYDNTSFELVGYPKVSELFFGIKRVSEWRLPYKSTLVVPVRYIPDDAMHTESNKQVIWGFLCIDCNRSNAFDPVFAPELAAAFADTLYTLFSQLELMKSLTPHTSSPSGS